MHRHANILPALALALCVLACGEEARLPPLPEGDNGLAARYLADFGIEKDAAVVFIDNFESGSTKCDNDWGVSCIQDAENVHSGKSALKLSTMPNPDKEVGCGAQRHFKEGYDALHIRYYLKFDKDVEVFHGGAHNGVSIAARAPGVPDAKPGIPADGRNEYTVLLDTWRPEEDIRSPGHLAIYIYHPEQRHRWGEHFFPSGRLQPYGATAAQYFGKNFVARPDVIPERGRWCCYELMVKANTPGQRDGRIGIWLDGKLIADFPNLRLRDVDSLKANRVGYGISTMNKKDVKPITLWLDDVVVATSYIGPMLKKEKPVPKVAEPAKPAAEKPAAPAVSAETLAQWDAKLAARIAKALKDGKRPSVFLKVPGGREERVKVLALEKESLSVELQGGPMPLRWKWLSVAERLNLARAVAADDSVEDCLTAAVFALADGRAELAAEYFAKASAVKDGVARVADVRAALGLK